MDPVAAYPPISSNASVFSLIFAESLMRNVGPAKRAFCRRICCVFCFWLPKSLAGLALGHSWCPNLLAGLALGHSWFPNSLAGLALGHANAKRCFHVAVHDQNSNSEHLFLELPPKRQSTIAESPSRLHGWRASNPCAGSARKIFISQFPSCLGVPQSLLGNGVANPMQIQCKSLQIPANPMQIQCKSIASPCKSNANPVHIHANPMQMHCKSIASPCKSITRPCKSIASSMQIHSNPCKSSASPM